LHFNRLRIKRLNSEFQATIPSTFLFSQFQVALTTQLPIPKIQLPITSTYNSNPPTFIFQFVDPRQVAFALQLSTIKHTLIYDPMLLSFFWSLVV
jgi:hypothetical protein